MKPKLGTDENYIKSLRLVDHSVELPVVVCYRSLYDRKRIMSPDRYSLYSNYRCNEAICVEVSQSKNNYDKENLL